MLEPKYLEDLPESVIELYSKVEQDILSDMARRLMAYDYWLDSSLWQEWKLKEVGVLYDDIVTAMVGITGKSQTEIRRVMREACTRALKADGRTYAAAGLAVPDFNSSKALKNTLNAGLKATLGTFKNLTGTTANTASRQFEDALDRAWLKIKSGAFSTDIAVRDAIKELSAAGVGAITYPSGRVDTLETAVRRAIVTGVNKTAGEVQWQLADEMGCDLVQVTAHGGARPEHAAWQGGIYSRSGKSRKYKDFKETTGYGTGAGLCGWNCRHSFGPYIEGAPKAYTDKMLENYNAEKYEYNGQKMTEYEASQKQREIERNIRRWKRENKAMEAAGLDTSESAVKIRSWQEKEKDFIRQTGLKRQSVRSQVGTFDRGDAVRASRAAREYYDVWSRSLGIDESIKTLAKYYDVKYNDSPRYELLQGYVKAVKIGDISPLVGFSVYEEVAKNVSGTLVGVTTPHGTTIKSFATHFIDRVIGQTSTPHAGMRQGVSILDVKATLENPVREGPVRYLEDGDIRQTLYGNVTVTYSIRDSRLIQTNPRQGG